MGKSSKFVALVILFLSLFASFTVYAQTAEVLLARDLHSAVSTFPHDSRIYHYVGISPTSSLNDPQVRQDFLDKYVRETTARFWDLTYVASIFINAGPGIYAATDPLISKSYGNALFEFTVPAGTIEFNIVHPIKLRLDTIHSLMSEGYLDKNGMSALFGSKMVFSRNTLKDMTQLQYTKFRSLVQTLFLKEGISLIEYNWDTSLAGFCRKHTYSAFVILTDTIKRIVTMVPPPENLSPEEILSTTRTSHFRTALESVKALKDHGEITTEMKMALFPSVADYDDIVSSIFGCEM